MKKRLNIIFLFIILPCITIYLYGCTKQNDKITNQEQQKNVVDLYDFEAVSNRAIKSLKAKDMEKLSQIVGDEGLKFSPYSYINPSDKTIQAIDLKNQMDNGEIINRGVYDGSGEPINLSFNDYYKIFVYDADFFNAPEKIINKIIERGNILNNIKDAYPNSQTIEYYFSGFDAKYEGMDRKSLTLIFTKDTNKRYLKSIVHGQRTI